MAKKKKMDKGELLLIGGIDQDRTAADESYARLPPADRFELSLWLTGENGSLRDAPDWVLQHVTFFMLLWHSWKRGCAGGANGRSPRPTGARLLDEFNISDFDEAGIEFPAELESPDRLINRLCGVTAMSDQELIELFSAAWRGVRAKPAKGDKGGPHFASLYVRQLQRANEPAKRRHVLTAMLAEGLGGNVDADKIAALWKDGDADGWARLADLAMLASMGK